MSEISKETLVNDLRNLGVRRGDSVMVHSSLSRLGPVAGGSETVVDAFLETIGPDGTMVFPTFTEHLWAGKLGMDDCKTCRKLSNYCPSNEPCNTGIIPEMFRKRPGSLRGCHPSFSWSALGPKAKLFTGENYKAMTPCGQGNPFDRLVEEDGCIVCLGLTVSTITLWHYYEEKLKVPYLGHPIPETRCLSYKAHGRRIYYEFPCIMDDVVMATGIMKVANIGKGSSRLIRARDFKKFLATIMADDPYCMIVRPPDETTADLAVDALQKAEAMLKAWEAGPKYLPEEIDWPDIDPKLIREDCPAFKGCHEAYGKKWSLCQANHRNPDLFKAGGIFNEHGICTCGQCPWNLKFPKQ